MTQNNEKFVSETELRVRYQETDQMGVVYHTNYLVWFEVGRSSWVRELGISYRELEKMGLLLPLIDAYCQYRSPARYDDEIIVRTHVGEVSRSKLAFYYEILRKEDAKLLAKGKTTHLWVNRQMKRVDVQKDYPEVYQLISRNSVEGS